MGRRRQGESEDGRGEATEQVASESRTDRLRIRAAWMYFVEQMTQNEIADVLGVGRVTIVRMLADARARNEVKITIESELSEIVRLERALEKTFGLQQALVAPLSAADADPIPAISAKTGSFLSDTMKSGMRVGVGWGQTLFSSLPFISAKSLTDFKVISLLGGVGVVRRVNPAEFAWRFAQIFQGDGYLMPTPAVVDSVETKIALIERCGLQEIFEMADVLDAVLLSVGGIASATTFSRGGFLKEADREALLARGAVGDLLFHFFDRNGDLVDHPVNSHVMSVDVDRLRKAPIRILTSGGEEKTEALLGAMTLIAPTILITDEESARRMLEAVSGS
ncbi:MULTISPECIES: sugar-binding transcriptional regulator [Mesorhizobium]|uniref:Sugar-binding domain-containing protein n=1 Tax=Mesorhizobium ciceri biovar biserrulae (strain HAMBI 2942 / LMG 23838 / WSM1271) TaxID=765698 RepID=E8T8I5_MESCW|nr:MULTISPECIES: sugar-binding transcriptional regulator [Mesorhizobium]RUZ90807.1 sugar-binding transcriptional regulator [Mesorhizobium sp. M7A.F.Ca.US.003.02.2.1]RVA45025.1 sugar-binding transcriptional regulator [Mesorhizobium sp. M7A.F.Ca.US.001.01.1.1]ADV10641.1 sugar-binding domain-containing protein [Mesorhizobium ciceri biovar biserrulae WSM1271]AMX95044.1 LacI family transcriptional regulator [Mesorhizobium ciceri]MDF3154692.1 sugar-binding transcriptional regulator [Mesorhizobium sp